MKLSVAYNGDLDLIEKLKCYKSVSNIFGAPSKMVTGGGRSSFVLPEITEGDIEKAVKNSHANNIEFNYVMNSACMGNKEYTDEKYKEIIEHLDWIKEIGADWITLANPYIIEVCKNRHPDLKISLSSFVTVESIQRAKYYDEIGVGEITVRENINRDFRLLEEMRKSVDCEIQLIANQACLYQCPYQFYHCNFVSHASQRDNSSSNGQIDFCVLKCNKYRFSDPTEIIKSCWIRPEDIKFYEEIGIDKFKITDRSSPTQWLDNVVKTYQDRKLKGNNLADILNLCIGVNRRKSNNSVIKDTDIMTKELKNMRKLVKAFALLEVNINNKELDGFIEHFKSFRCKEISCDSCGYCEEVSKRAIEFPYPQSVKRGVRYIDDLLNDVIDNREII